MWGFPPFSYKCSVGSAFLCQAFYLYVYVLQVSRHILSLICPFFLLLLINNYLGEKTESAATKLLFYKYFLLSMWKYKRHFYFWCFWNMKQKWYQPLTPFSIVLSFFSALIFFKNTTLPSRKSCLYTRRFLLCPRRMSSLKRPPEILICCHSGMRLGVPLSLPIAPPHWKAMI